MSHLMQVSKKFFESIKEGPMRKYTNGFDSVNGIILFSRPIVNVLHVQPSPLFFCHFFFGKAFVKGYRRAVYLLKQMINSFISLRFSSTVTNERLVPFLQRPKPLRQMWRILALELQRRQATIPKQLPLVSKTRVPNPALGCLANPSQENELECLD